jgi:HTH-type transcriptional regulator/antitoxin HipB
MRQALKDSRHRRGWSQAELGQRLGLPQMHISGIETGKIVPRFDTLLELVRVPGYDLLLVPRDLVPLVQNLTRDRGGDAAEEDLPLYKPDEPDEQSSSTAAALA